MLLKSTLQTNENQGRERPRLLLSGLKGSLVTSLVEFIYLGECSVLEEDLDQFFKTGADFGVQGIDEVTLEDGYDEIGADAHHDDNAEAFTEGLEVQGKLTPIDDVQGNDKPALEDGYEKIGETNSIENNLEETALTSLAVQGIDEVAHVDGYDEINAEAHHEDNDEALAKEPQIEVQGKEAPIDNVNGINQAGPEDEYDEIGELASTENNLEETDLPSLLEVHQDDNKETFAKTKKTEFSNVWSKIVERPPKKSEEY